MDDLGNAVVVVVIFCDIVSSTSLPSSAFLSLFSRYGRPGSGEISFSASPAAMVGYKVGFRCIHRETNGRFSLVNTGERRVSGIHCWRRKRLIVAVCKVSGLFKIITEMLLFS